MPDAAYYRAWRAAHPEYKKRQVKITAEKRKLFGRESRMPEYAKRPSRATVFEEMPALHIGHELFTQARELLGYSRSTLTTLYDPTHEDLLSEAILAILEGRDPKEAAKKYKSKEMRWSRVTAPLLFDLSERL